MDTKPASEASPLERIEAARAARATNRAQAVEAADLEVALKYEEFQGKTDDDLMIFADPAGLFRGVFRPPTPSAWKIWKAEFRSETQRPVCNQNLAVACMLWPTHEALAVHAAKRPALYDAIGQALQISAGPGDELIVKK